MRQAPAVPERRQPSPKTGPLGNADERRRIEKWIFFSWMDFGVRFQFFISLGFSVGSERETPFLVRLVVDWI
jgi:hypothetical protein